MLEIENATDGEQARERLFALFLQRKSLCETGEPASAPVLITARGNTSPLDETCVEEQSPTHSSKDPDSRL
jgi:hypothetical protein